MYQINPHSCGRSSSWEAGGSSSCALNLGYPVFGIVRPTPLFLLVHDTYSLAYILADEVEKRAPITVKFEIPYFTVSGIQVRYLKIVEKSGYQALPWVRYITQHGDDYR